MRFFFLSLPLVAACSSVSSDGVIDHRDDTLEEQILHEIDRRDPELVLLWEQADLASQLGEYEISAQYREIVFALAPDWPHAARRACWSRLDAGQNDTAVRLCESALAIERSSENLLALAITLIEAREDYTLGLLFATEAADVDPDNYWAFVTQCEAATALDKREVFATCAAGMERLAPEWDATQFFATTAAVYRNDFASARWHAARRAPSKRAEAKADVQEYERIVKEFATRHCDPYDGVARTMCVAAGP